jgi:hypothetical protein
MVVDEEAWTPAWTLPELKVTNIASGDGAAELQLVHSPVRLVKRATMFVAVQTVRFTGDLYEALPVTYFHSDFLPHCHTGKLSAQLIKSAAFCQPL